MAGGYKEIHKHCKANTNGFDKNPDNINKEGRPKNRPLKELLENIGEDDFTIKIPLSRCEIHDDYVSVKLPTKEYIAQNLQTKAAKDVRWFREWAKVMGEYAAEKLEHTGKDGEPIEVKQITGMEIK